MITGTTIKRYREREKVRGGERGGGGCMVKVGGCTQQSSAGKRVGETVSKSVYVHLIIHPPPLQSSRHHFLWCQAVQKQISTVLGA